MSRDLDADDAPLTSVEQLVAYFQTGSKPSDQRGIGTEHEKFLFRGPQFELTAFDGPGGIEDLFGRLQDRYGWEPAPDRGRTVALVRGGEAITLEPAGQVELSGAVTKTIFETRDELDRHLRELADVCGDEYHAVSFGLNPWDDLYSVPIMPKARYAVMDRYLATRGDLARWMMQGTCTIQANLDYRSEEDAVSLIRAAILASPFVNALFANSPIRLREHTGMQSFRAHIWTRTDPDRCGVPAFMYRDDWGFREWAEWVLDVPMFFIRRATGYIDMAGHSFRDFMHSGYDGHTATMGDFELHVSTVFPEVRMKRFIEVRSADGGSREHIFALPALWKGLSYDDQARADVFTLFDGVTAAEHFPMFDHAAREGLHGSFAGRPVSAWCDDLISIARAGLGRIAERDGHDDEAAFLEPLRTDRSQSDDLLADFAEHGGAREALIVGRDLLGHF